MFPYALYVMSPVFTVSHQILTVCQIIFLLTMALHWGIIKLSPVKLVLGVGYFQWWIVKNMLPAILHYGLVPRTFTKT